MKRIVACASCIALLSIYLYKMRAELQGIAAVFVYMTVFSLTLAPVCRKLENQGVKPSLAGAYAVIGLFLIVFVALAALIPYLVTRSFYLFKRIAPIAREMMNTWELWAANNVFIKSAFLDADSVLGVSLNGLTGKLAKAGMSAAAQLGRIGFALVPTYYVLCDRRRLGNHLMLLVPLSWRNPVLMGMCACRNAMMGYFSGLVKTSLFVSGATCIGLLLLGVQDAVLLSVIMGVLEILPYLGPVLAAIPILLSAMMQGTQTVLLTIALLVLVQQIEGSVISPYFTASSTSVHPLAAVLGVFVLGSLLGLWGILIAVPLMVLLQSIGWSWIQARRMQRDAD